jgi:alkylhydroperoxidase/carboxymuconolactone decarboxylase family protein YurZ
VADIFISYARADLERAKTIAEALQAHGWKVWWDIVSLRTGQPFNRAIQEALSQVACVVVLWSETSIESSWVEAEAYWAWRHKKLASVILDEELQLPVPFNTTHAEKLCGWSGDTAATAFRKLIADLTEVVDAAGGEPGPIPRNRPAPEPDQTEPALAVDAPLTTGPHEQPPRTVEAFLAWHEVPGHRPPEPNGDRGVFHELLYQGAWWSLCREVAAGTAPQDWLAGLPALEELDAFGRTGGRPRLAAALEQWQQRVPIGRLFDPRHLPIAVAQLHCTQLAVDIAKGWTAANPNLAPASPALRGLASLLTIASQVPAKVQPDRTDPQALHAATAAWTLQLRFWVARLLTPATNAFDQRINVLWLSGSDSGVKYLILRPVPGAADTLLIDPAFAFVQVDEPFRQAALLGWRVAREALLQAGTPWPEDTGLAWRLQWRSAESQGKVDGPSAGGAFALGAYLLGRRSAWTPAAGDGSPLLDPELTKGLAVSAAIRPDTGGFTRVGGFVQRLRQALLTTDDPAPDTLLEAADQPLEEAQEFTVVEPGSTAVLQHTSAGRRFTLIRAQDLSAAINRLESHLHRRWGSALPVLANIHRFMAHYLGRPSQPVPFGGRDAALAALDAWIDDPGAPPCLLLTAPAGLGKSALLVQWVARHFWVRAEEALLFLPVSLRFGTSETKEIADGLFARLLALHGKPQPTEEDGRTTAEKLADVAISLRKPLPDGRRLLLVIDGLDEAANWRDLQALLTPLAAGTRLLVAARPLAGHTAAEGWREHLGWSVRETAQPVALQGLDRHGMVDVLLKMGAPLDGLAHRERIIDRLLALTEGEPLLTRFYVEDLWGQGETVTGMQPEVLDDPALKAGLAGYFARWWDEQVRNNPNFRTKAIRETLSILACALGPLTRQDLRRLLPDILVLSSDEFDGDLLPTLGRWLVGDAKNTGFVLSHPRLGVFFREEQLDEGEVLAIEARFLVWGRQTLAGLNVWANERARLRQRDAESWLTEESSQPLAPAYLLQFYGAHLQRAYQEQREHPERRYFESLQEGLDALEGLVSEGWLRAWERFEDGTYAGFLGDVDRVYVAATAVDRTAAAQGKDLTRLGTRIRCVLCRAGVNALTSQLPLLLVVRLVETGSWHLMQALATARRIPDKIQRAEMLVGLEPWFSEKERPDILAEALQAARAIESEWHRARALATLAPQYPKHERTALFAEALQAARVIGDEKDRARALKILAPHLDSPLLEQALEAARAIGDEEDRAWALGTLAPQLDGPLLEQALQAAQDIGNEEHRTRVLEALAPRLSGPPLEQALEAARAIGDEEDRARALGTLAPQIPEYERPTVLTEALQAARGISWAENRAKALAALAPDLPEHERLTVVTEALQAVRISPRDISHFPGALAPHLSDSLLEQALQIAINYWNVSYRKGKRYFRRDSQRIAWAFDDLAPYLSDQLLEQALQLIFIRELGYSMVKPLAVLAPKLNQSLLEQALQAARDIGDKDDRAEALVTLAPYLSGPLLEQALQAVRDMGNEGGRARVLAILAPKLSGPTLEQALQLARATETKKYRAEALVALAPRYPEHKRTTLFAEALQDVREIGDKDDRFWAIRDLAPYLSGPLLEQALQTAQMIGDKASKGKALVAFAPHLSGPLLKQALQAVWAIKEPADRVRALRDLAPYLSGPLLEQALQIAGTLWRPEDRAWALKILAPRLSGPQLRQALHFARAISDAKVRAAAFVALTPWRPRSLLNRAFRVRHTGARSIANLWTAALRVVVSDIGAHAALAPQHSSPLLALALKIVRANPDFTPRDRAMALVALAPQLSGPLLEQALLAADKIWSGGGYKTVALVALAPQLSGPMLEQALQLARAIETKKGRAEALAALAPRYPEHKRTTLFAEALQAIRAIGDEKKRAWALATLAPQYPKHERTALFAEALQAAREIGDEKERFWALKILAPMLDRASASDLIDLELAALQHDRRAATLDALSGWLGTLISRWGDPRAGREIASTIVDVCRWWP